MAQEYRAVVLEAPHAPPVVQRRPAPVLGEGEALLHTLHAEVCGTDVHLHHGKLAGVPYPIIPGHVAVGQVAAIRGTVRHFSGERIREGDVVTYYDVHGTCNNCYYCLIAKEPTRCPSRRVYGISYSANDGLLGGWAEAIWARAGLQLIPLPTEALAKAFIGGGCGLVTALHAVDMARIRLDASVVVLGAGPVGLSAVALAALSGAGEIIAIGDPELRRGFAARMGATKTLGLSVDPEARVDAVRERTEGRGADVVIEATGRPEAVSQALDLVRDGGRVVIAGHYTDNGTVTVHPHYQINRKHVEILGCWGVEFLHFQRAVDLVARFGDRIPWAMLAEERFALDDADLALDAVADGTCIKAIISPPLERRRAR
jgi:threonine dehydrogenase-like Zn-dependent dehydrogenase